MYRLHRRCTRSKRLVNIKPLILRCQSMSGKDIVAQKEDGHTLVFRVSTSEIENFMNTTMSTETKTTTCMNCSKFTVWKEEIKSFCGVSTIHGLLRAYRDQTPFRQMWITIIFICLILLFTQSFLLINDYLEKPVVSQVSFRTADAGLKFPLVTLCNFNPVRHSYIEELNKTGHFSEGLFHYLVKANAELQAFYGTADLDDLQRGDKEFQNFRENYNMSFNINEFFEDGGYKCNDVFKICSFAGQKFNCCEHAKPVMTSLGRCFTIDISAQGWFTKQLSPGEYNGLHLILDSGLNEIHSGMCSECNESSAVFTNSFENGFRFYVHDREMVSFITTEGISVSPGSKLYSSLEADKFLRLSLDNWGRCSDWWPSHLPASLPYSRKNCRAACHAQYFNRECSCAPYVYNTMRVYRTCSPIELYECMTKTINFNYAGSAEMETSCRDCHIECKTMQYHAYNSYGFGFSRGALKWLRETNRNWTTMYIRQNFVMISLFYRDLSYTLFNEEKGNCISLVLSQIGGLMGLTFGMSVFSLVELIMFCGRISWTGLRGKHTNKVTSETSQPAPSYSNVEPPASHLRSRLNSWIQDMVQRRQPQGEQQNSTQQMEDNFPAELVRKIEIEVKLPSTVACEASTYELTCNKNAVENVDKF